MSVIKQQTSSFLTNARYKENPRFWTYQKLVNVCENSKKEKDEYKGFANIIKKHKLGVNELLSLSETELDHIFDYLYPFVVGLKKELQSSGLYIDESITVTYTQEVEGSYFPNPTSSQSEQSQRQISQSQDRNQIQKTLYSAQSTKSYQLFDYDDYPSMSESMSELEEIVKQEEFKKLQKAYENYIKSENSVYLEMKINQDSDVYQLIEDQSNYTMFYRKLDLLSNRTLKFDCIDKMFYVEDLGSNHGTFIKYKSNKLPLFHENIETSIKYKSNKIPLFLESIFMIGSQQFRIVQLLQENDKVTLSLRHYEGETSSTSFEKTFSINKGQQQSIGKAFLSSFGSKINQDQKISENHAILSYDGIMVKLQNINNNETWFRLSAQNKKSQKQSLLDVESLMVKENIIQICIKLNNKYHKEQIIDKALLDCNMNKCHLCKIEQQKVCFKPCDHKIYCQQCYLKVQPNICPNQFCLFKIIYTE